MQKNILLLFVFLISIFVFSSIFFKTVNGDEAIIAEHAYRFANEGIVRSVMFTGMGEGWEVRQYHFHKLFVYAGSLVYSVFGNSLTGLRLITFFFVFLFFIFSYKYIVRILNIEINFFYTFIIILFSNVLFYEYSYIYRPEMMVMSLGFISFYFLSAWLKYKQYYKIILSGIFAGLSAFTHLNGIIFIFSGFLLLLANKEFKFSILFGIIASLTALMYFADISTANELQAFWIQFSSDPNLSKSDFSLLSPFIKVLREHERLFRYLYTSGFTLVFIVSVIFHFKLLKKKYFDLFIYLIFLVIGLAAISHGKTIKYSILYYPYLAIIIILAIKNFKETKKIQKIVFIAFGIFFFYFNIFSIIKKVNLSYNTIVRTEKIASFLPLKNVNVLATEGFYFNGMENYSVRITLSFVILYNKYLRKTPAESDFYNFAKKEHNKYIIIDSRTSGEFILALLRFKNLKENENIESYQVIKKTDDFAILELIN